MGTHPYWRPHETVTPKQMSAATVVSWPARPVEVVAPDPAWRDAFATLTRLVRAALGDRVVSIDHVGSTSIPQMWAKPLIDIDLIVADSSAEASYAPDLEAGGFTLIIREPDWHEHRMFSFNEPRCNLHVFSPDAVEPKRHMMFRDWLSTHADDHAAYRDIKRSLAERSPQTVWQYNNDKSALIYEIYERIFAADSAHAHTPHPIE
jgi:GrpB-like predicted nucleotidyltransferase (UPF0157 family)